jgi:integrative and conjugative element protein (TIGR02256 family)
VEQLANDWLGTAGLSWARVYEDRPEVTTRRDAEGPLEALRNRRILILGCGALGGHVAEHVVRAGTEQVMLIDNSRVSPGVLVRQPYDDADITEPKATALAARLQRIHPDLDVVARFANANEVLDEGTPDVDLIIDATANPMIAARMERRRRAVDTWPPIVTLIIGHTAGRGIALLAQPGYSGGATDLLRKVKITTSARPELREFADDFFPDPPRTDYFQPEPGCSEATFVGSDAEVAALAAILLTHVSAVLAEQDTQGSAILVDIGLGAPSPAVRLSWPADVVHKDDVTGYEIRLTPTAAAVIRAECRLMHRRRGPTVETGGVLLGEIDDACRVVWVTAATGPPPDSTPSPNLFVCGIEGVEELVAARDKATRGAERFIGMWHSHPGGRAAPSPTDREGMRELLVPVVKAPRRALLLIVGGRGSRWTGWRDDGSSLLPDVFVQLCEQPRGTPDEVHVGFVQTFAPSLVGEVTRRWPLPGGTASPPHRRARFLSVLRRSGSANA